MGENTGNARKLLIPLVGLGVVGLAIICCCGGILGGDSDDDNATSGAEQSTKPPAAQAEPADGVADVASGTTDVQDDAQPPEQAEALSAEIETSPWDSDTVVRLPDDDGEFEKHFWPFFDDLAGDRADAAVADLKEDKPATWESEESGVRASAAADRKQARTEAEGQVYRYRVPSSFDLPTYDSQTGGFPLEVPSVLAVDTGLLGGKSGWWLALGRKPKVERNGTEITDKSGNPMTMYSHTYTGGQPLQATIPVAQADADAFYKEHNGRLKVELLFKFKDGTVDVGGPEYKITKTGSLWEIALENATVSAGRAVVVDVVGWRVLSGSAPVAEWVDEEAR